MSHFEKHGPNTSPEVLLVELKNALQIARVTGDKEDVEALTERIEQLNAQTNRTDTTEQ